MVQELKWATGYF